MVLTCGVAFNVLEHYIRTLRPMNFNKLFFLVPNQHLSRQILLANLTLKFLPCILDRIIRVLLCDFTFCPLLQAGIVDVLLVAFAVAGRDEEVIIKNFLDPVDSFPVFKANTTGYFAVNFVVLVVFFMFKVEVSFSLCVLEFSRAEQQFPNSKSHSSEFDHVTRLQRISLLLPLIILDASDHDIGLIRL